MSGYTQGKRDGLAAAEKEITDLRVKLERALQAGEKLAVQRDAVSAAAQQLLIERDSLADELESAYAELGRLTQGAS